tara:strand:- start:337 stop:930 length:594 start_codon:yes stop_codon:yes gene_type:complete
MDLRVRVFTIRAHQGSLSSIELGFIKKIERVALGMEVDVDKAMTVNINNPFAKQGCFDYSGLGVYDISGLSAQEAHDFLTQSMKRFHLSICHSRNYLHSTIGIGNHKIFNRDQILQLYSELETNIAFIRKHGKHGIQHNDLTIQITFPENLSEDEVREKVKSLVLEINRAHRKLGGDGLKLDNLSAYEVTGVKNIIA